MSLSANIQICGFAYSKTSKTLLVDYREEKEGKPCCKKLRFQKLSETETVESVTKYLTSKYPKLFSNSDQSEYDKVIDALSFAIEDLLADYKRVQSLLNNLGEVDLNRVSEEENMLAKKKMDEVFEVTRLKPGDPGFVWDKRIDFSPPEEVCEWDE